MYVEFQLNKFHFELSGLISARKKTEIMLIQPYLLYEFRKCATNRQ